MFGLSPPAPGVRKFLISLSVLLGLVTAALPMLYEQRSVDDPALWFNVVFWPPAIWIVLNGVLLALFGRAVLPALWITPLVVAWPCIILVVLLFLASSPGPLL